MREYIDIQSNSNNLTKHSPLRLFGATLRISLKDEEESANWCIERIKEIDHLIGVYTLNIKCKNSLDITPKVSKALLKITENLNFNFIHKEFPTISLSDHIKHSLVIIIFFFLLPQVLSNLFLSSCISPFCFWPPMNGLYNGSLVAYLANLANSLFIRFLNNNYWSSYDHYDGKVQGCLHLLL